jgi:hypothetical protein
MTISVLTYVTVKDSELVVVSSFQSLQCVSDDVSECVSGEASVMKHCQRRKAELRSQAGQFASRRKMLASSIVVLELAANPSRLMHVSRNRGSNRMLIAIVEQAIALRCNL